MHVTEMSLSSRNTLRTESAVITEKHSRSLHPALKPALGLLFISCVVLPLERVKGSHNRSHEQYRVSERRYLMGMWLSLNLLIALWEAR